MKDRRLLTGLLLILVGLVLALDNFGFIPWELWYLTSWKTLIIVIGVFLIISSKNKVAGTIMILVGGFFLAREIFDLWHYGWRDLWPFILIFIGILIIVRKRIHESYQSTTEDRDIDTIDDMNVLGGGEKIITSRNFKGGKITNILGGGEYDFTQTTLSGDRNVIDLFCLFGGVNLRVPPDWNVRVEVTPILGGFSDKRRMDPNAIPDPRKEIFIRGLAILGGGEVRN